MNDPKLLYSINKKRLHIQISKTSVGWPFGVLLLCTCKSNMSIFRICDNCCKYQSDPGCLIIITYLASFQEFLTCLFWSSSEVALLYKELSYVQQGTNKCKKYSLFYTKGVSYSFLFLDHRNNSTTAYKNSL